MKTGVSRSAGILAAGLAAVTLFAGGYVAGQNRFGQPKTILHLVMIKWSPLATDADKHAALEGVKDLAAKVPGVKNIWVKADRLQPRGQFDAAFAIEFKDRDAADAYAESPLHAKWEEKYVPLRAASISEQITNP